MKNSHLILVSIIFIAFSCKKDEKTPCIDVKFEISSTTPVTVDSIDFRLAGDGAGYHSPDDSRFYSNLNLPYSEEVTLCKSDFDYNLRCYDSDTSTTLTLKIFKDGVLKDQITSSPNNMIELGGGIND